MNASPLLHAFRPILRELAPTLLFIAIVTATNNVALATIVGGAIGILGVGWNLWKREPIQALQWLGLILVLVLGGATLLTHDPRFILAKPTIVFAAVGATMLKPGWQMAYVPPIALPHLPPGTITRWGYAWAGLMFALSIGNAILALGFPLPVWSLFHTIVPMPAIILLFAAQYVSVRGAVVASIRKSAIAPQGASPN